jgi:hypothetical protein
MPVPAGSLRPGEPAPVDIYSDEGDLLLAQGQVAESERLRKLLNSQRFFIDESLAHKWKGR